MIAEHLMYVCKIAIHTYIHTYIHYIQKTRRCPPPRGARDTERRDRGPPARCSTHHGERDVPGGGRRVLEPVAGAAVGTAAGAVQNQLHGTGTGGRGRRCRVVAGRRRGAAGLRQGGRRAPEPDTEQLRAAHRHRLKADVQTRYR